MFDGVSKLFLEISEFLASVNEPKKNIYVNTRSAEKFIFDLAQKLECKFYLKLNNV